MNISRSESSLSAKNAAATDRVVELTASEIARQIEDGRLMVDEVVETYLNRIELHDPFLNAFVEVYGDEARRSARGCQHDLLSGRSRGALHGVPIALKDNIAIEGKLLRGGSAPWRHSHSGSNAPLVNQLIDAGAIVVGKTHTTEFSYGGWGINLTCGTPRNPWDAAAHRVPGGSSSGSGVAVSAGLVPLAIGTDTGGSVRLPAAYCGVVGLRPTSDRISMAGVLSLAPTLDSVGPIGSSVEDVARAYAVMSGDLDVLRALSEGAQQSSVPLRGLHIGSLGARDSSHCAADVLRAYKRTIASMSELGASVREVDLPVTLSKVADLTATLIAAEAYATWGAIVEEFSRQIDPEVRRFIQRGAAFDETDRENIRRVRSQMLHEMARTMCGLDALILPTTPDVAPIVSAITPAMNPALYTRVASYFGLCCLALPNGASAEGLPTSCQIMCRAYDESTVFRIGMAYEAQSQWHRRFPPVRLN